MTGFRITNINWVADENDKAASSLPKAIGFKKDDDFDTSRIPMMLKKKFGYEVSGFNIERYRIAKNIEELLEICNPSCNKKSTAIFGNNGSLSKRGKDCLSRLQNQIVLITELRKKSTADDKMPKLLTEILIGIQNITGLDTDNMTVNDMCKAVRNEIDKVETRNLLSWRPGLEEEEDECEY